MERTDTHTHTFYSGHGVGSVGEVVHSAVALGLSVVALTEHMPLPPAIDVSGTFAMTDDQVPMYLQELCEARLQHPKIEVICGTEIDWREGAESYILARLEADRAHLGWTTNGGYELLLGSVHMLTDPQGDFWEFDHGPSIGGWQERGEEKVWLRYLELWTDAVNSKVPFDIMTHPDLPKKLGFKPKFDTREYYAAMAEVAVKKGVLIEVNTSGLRYPVGELYPAPALLKAFCEAGAGCTVSSDAHAPELVGCDLDQAYAAMAAAGYKHVTVPTCSGDRRFIPLEVT